MSAAISDLASHRARRRGEPLMVLALIVTGWIGARAFAWEGPAADGVEMLLASSGTALAASATRGPASAGSDRWTPWPYLAGPEAGRSYGAPRGDAMAYAIAGDRRDQDRRAGYALAYGSRSQPAGAAGSFGWSLPSGASAAELEPAGLGADRADRRTVSPGGNAAPFPVAPVLPGNPRRWSGDAWLLARQGAGPSLAGGPAPTTYGASQAGAILRYALAPSSRFRPAAYARVSSAVSGIDEAEAALGLSARPLRRLPVIALAELRATRSAGRIRLRPAAMLVTQVPPLPLSLGMRGEVYAQAGYVAGRGATPFADGQFTFDRALVRLAGHDLRVGGGLWGGAQKGAARLDLGPSARVDLTIGRRIFTRLSLDYRLRVAGDASPGSGPALTAAAGF